MGGIGKTTLAQLLYNDVRVEHHFDLRAWASVSEEFDVHRITQNIYESLTSDACQIVSLNLLQSKLKAALVGKKFFFVLDDVWNKNYDQWDKLRCPFEFGAHGSKIIVTTRNEDVASMMSTVQTQPHCLMPISEEDGWLLFEKHAFKRRGVGAHSHLEEIGRQIVRKCKGLPLAVKSLGGLLCSKLIVEEWECILHSDMWELSQEESDILPSLWLSYVYLPLHLKCCFTYCSIFPKNYRFQKLQLVLLWKAQGLLQPKKKKMVDEVGEEYFNDLISRSFFQRSSGSEYFIMHDLINDLASFVSGEFCVRWEDSESPNILRKTRHFLYMEKHGDSFAKLEVIRQAKYLRTLLPVPQYAFYLGTFNGEKFRDVLYEVLPKLQFLRVLNLSLYDIKELPDSINNLKHLRHLDMSETPIRKLPDTICTLYNLQTLLLQKCRNLTELPPNFGRLINLTHLDFEGSKIEKMPPHMGNLKDLQILSEFVLDRYIGGHNALELKKLQNLRGTLCISGIRNVVHGSALEADILRDKKFLTELILNWGYFCEKDDMVEEREVLDKFQPHLNVERLIIDGYGGKMFPGWSRYYSSSALVFLVLHKCVNCISLPPLGQLPSLRDLHISELSGVVSIGSEFYYGDKTTCVNKPFRSLRSLRFQFMSGLQEWSRVGDDDNEHGVFPNLRELHLSNCPNLSGILTLDSFPVLKVVILIKTCLSHITSSQECPTLVGLTLSDCPKFVSLPDGGLHAPAPNLLSIFRWKKLGSWREQMYPLLPSLEYLWMRDCPELECFPGGGFPSKLKSLHIERCKKFNANSMENLNKGLRRLTSLETLTLDFDGCEEVDSFPEKKLLPSTLTYLDIYRLNIMTMDGAKWFGHLNSLTRLAISHCYALQCLPDTGLPASLCFLRIRGCPLLAQRCQREKGEDWPKIAHIGQIEIDGCRT